MKQGILPLIPSGATEINGFYSVFNNGKEITWFQGHYPIRTHLSSDYATQRAMMGFLNVHGNVPQSRISAALGIHENTVRAAVKLYRDKGDPGFYAQTGVRGAVVMTPDVIERCRQLLADGMGRRDVAEALGVKKCNIDKAIQKGTLPPSMSYKRQKGSTRSERAQSDCASEMGMACVRAEERAMAAAGLLSGAESRFEECKDIERGGVLCALPALADNGLFDHLCELDLSEKRGFYYQLTQIFILLALMALLRVKTVEALRRDNPGEFGKLLGLDRIPEVRCLRNRLKSIPHIGVQRWANTLSKSWMEADPESAGTLYIDGHVRVYNGSKTQLPRRYCASRRLCMRGVTDYWVNDKQGNPFFYINRPVDDGLLSVLRAEIIPRLLKDVPQPSEEELKADPLLMRLHLIFDRAGSSPMFFIEAWKNYRIGCTTYLKGPTVAWPENEFRKVNVLLSNGQYEEMEFAERGIWFARGKEGIWCREFRRLRRGKYVNYQTAIVSTDYHCSLAAGASAMFARWAQEIFFKYMMTEFGLNLLSDHSTEVFPCCIQVVNPLWRELESSCRSLRGKIAVLKVRMADLDLKIQNMEFNRMEHWESEKSKLIEEILVLEQLLSSSRLKRKETPKHVRFDDLPEEHKFERLSPTRKMLLDTVKMIAYRAESALAQIAREELSSPEEARAMVRALFNTSADLQPDPLKKELLIILHPLAEARQNRMAESILSVLNLQEFCYPGTELKMVYQMLAPAKSGNI